MTPVRTLGARGAETVPRARTLSLAVVAAGIVTAVVAPGPMAAAGPLLLVLAVVAGLPHGAADVLLLPWRARPLAAYALVALVALVVALAFPGPALLVLLLVSVVHFAEGEQAFDRLRGGPGDLVAAVAVAWVAVALPLALHPSAVRGLLTDLSPGAAGVLLSGVGRVGLLLVAAALVVLGLLRADRRQAGELLLVVALFAVAPPLAAFALWFAGWHAVRHTARIMVVEQTGLRRLALSTLAPSLAAGVGLLALVLLLPAAGAVPAALVLGLLALTVPHAVVVARTL